MRIHGPKVPETRRPFKAGLVAIALVFMIVSIAQVSRTAIVDLRTEPSDLGNTIWPSHPAVLGARIIKGVGEAAAHGAVPSEEILAQIRELGAAEPLAAEPYLVHGAIALRSGDYPRAEALLSTARQRAPRSAASRYLMADLYLRTNRPVGAMAEMAVLNRLLPAGSVQMAPSLSAYARVPGSLPQIRSVLRSYPELEEPLLALLSADIANSDAILQLASPRVGEGKPPVWQGMLLTNMVAGGKFGAAYDTWRRLSGIAQPPGALFNPQFDASNAPPPFNWRIADGAGAIVEPSSGGLDISYFGRENVVLAAQTVILSPGRYRLGMNVSGSFSDGSPISWAVKCLPAGKEIAILKLSSAQPVTRDFVVPAGQCPAQSLALMGVAGEASNRSEFRVSGVQLTRIGG